jgi:hypothetical protein
LKCTLPSFLSPITSLHIASWSSGEKRFSVCEKDTVENTGILRPDKRFHMLEAVGFLQKVDAEK